jgi:hypothetical protein
MKSVPVSEASGQRPKEGFCHIAARLCLTLAFMGFLTDLQVVLQTPKCGVSATYVVQT